MWFYALCGLGLLCGLCISERNPLKGNRVMSNVNHRIVGGEEASIGDFPHQVSFVVNRNYFCGGFIVSHSYILTAAHCAQDAHPSQVVLRAGSSYREKGTIIPVAEIVSHPEFNDPSYDKDIAYMKTEQPIQFSKTIQPIELPPLDRTVKGDIVVAGWGKTHQFNAQLPHRLMKVELPVIDYQQCLTSYPTILTNNMVCAGRFFLGGKGPCQGDSGGSAIQDGLAVGIVSFGRICGAPLSPAVFANIASPPIRNFIFEHTGL